ncbi:MAG: metallophosphoesterase [Treponema sp.]|jgi:Icc-related predicted phosphoesterase|nr:metallophosphoesterase [Treponema sp.]
MKILCVSDQIDPLVYSPFIKERFGDVDMVLSAGDLPMEYLEFIVSSLNKPLLFVFGNHNLEEYGRYTGESDFPIYDIMHEGRSSGAIYVNSGIRREEGLIIMGLGGSMKYNNGKNQYSSMEMFWKIIVKIPVLIFNRIFYGRYLDILLTHAPPEGIHDRQDLCHRGFRAFLWFMRTFKPGYLVHGHIHLYDLSAVRVTRYCQTTVLNAFGHYMIDTEADPRYKETH